MTEQARHWRTAARAMAVLARVPGVTRAELGRHLGLASGPASDLVKRLSEVELVREQPAPQQGRGRPTTTLGAHPAGPVAVVVDLRHGDWRLGTCAVDGAVQLTAGGRHDGRSPERVLAELASHVEELTAALGSRVLGVGLAVPGTAWDDRFVTVTMLGWQDWDVAALAPALPLVVANDATMAAVAEARHQPGRTLLHVVVEAGLGGAYVVDARPVASARGLHGEFGHLPFGDPRLACPCGARGCWNTAFDPDEVARRAGGAPAADARAWLATLYADPDSAPTGRRAASALAEALGRGTAGLVNALDPEVVTLGGLGPLLRDAEPAGFDRALHGGLMAVHREHPPQVVNARAGDDATLVGLGLSVFDRVLDADRLAAWADSRGGSR